MFGLSFGASVLLVLSIILGSLILFAAFIFYMEYKAKKALENVNLYLYQVPDSEVLKLDGYKLDAYKGYEPSDRKYVFKTPT